MDYDALMAFATFAEHLNFTHAARTLFISQPALHAKVRKLADQIGTPLYSRQGRTLHLTHAGRTLATHARQIHTLTQDTLANLDETHAPVTLAAGAGAITHMLGPWIKHITQTGYPLSLMVSSAPSALAALREARAHVALGTFSVFSARTDDLLVIPWRTVGQMVAMPCDHPLAHRKHLCPQDLAHSPLIIAPQGMPHRITTQAVLAAHEVPWTVAVEATEWAVMVRLVEYGLGLSIINDFVRLPPGLVGVPISGFKPLVYELAMRQNEPFEGARWLFELLREDEDTF